MTMTPLDHYLICLSEIGFRTFFYRHLLSSAATSNLEVPERDPFTLTLTLCGALQVDHRLANLGFYILYYSLNYFYDCVLSVAMSDLTSRQLHTESTLMIIGTRYI